MSSFIASVTVILSLRLALSIAARRRVTFTQQVNALLQVFSTPPSAQPSAACLFIHGYAVTPAEFYTQALVLRSRGLDVVLPWLPDHGQAPVALNDADFDQWSSVMGSHLLTLRRKYRSVFVVGRSTGGTIAIDLATRYQIDGLVLINPLLYLKRYGTVQPERFVTAIRILTPYVPYLLSLNMSRREDVQYAVGYPLVPTGNTRRLSEYAASVHTRARGVTAPVLLVTSRRDRIVDPASSDAFAEAFTSVSITRLFLDKSGHMALLDWDGPAAIRAIADFLSSHLTK